MRRRKFIALIGSAAATWPFTAHTQQPMKPTIGLLSFGSPSTVALRLQTFRQALKDYGFVEGQNLSIDARWMGEHYDQMPAAAADLVNRQVAVIVAAGTPACFAAKAATKKIPIVFTTGGDPIQLGIVASVNRPTENVTGAVFPLNDLVTKQLDLLHLMLPGVKTVGLLLNPRNPQAQGQLRDASPVLQPLGIKLAVAKASAVGEIDAAFADLVAQQANALLVGADGFFNTRREQIVELAARSMIPTLYPLREYVEAGGLASYGTSPTEAWHQAGIYTARILKGEMVADLPVIQTTKFEFIFNRKTARTLGMKISDNVLSLADDVIE